MLLNFPFRTGLYFVNTTAAQVTNCRITNVGGSQVGGLVNCAIEMDGVSGCIFNDSTLTPANRGICNPQGSYSVARRNTIINSTYGLINITKYQDNLTVQVTNPFLGNGTDAGGNN